MEKETLKNILYFLEKVDGAKIPFLWKITNGSPLTKDELNIDDDLDLSNFKITSLPEGLKVGGDLNLLDSEIRFLPEGLEVGGDLNLQRSNIKSLPNRLKVGGDLDLYGCEQLELLPEGLVVGRDLYIYEALLLKYTDEELIKMIDPKGNREGYIKGNIIRR
jgi:hypothetical protein